MTSPPGPGETSVLQGRLEDFPLADVLQVLQVAGKSGAFFLRREGGHNGVVVLEGGKMVRALSTESNATLGERLLTSGAISPIDVQEALARVARSPGMRMGDALVEQGALSRERVEAEVTAQMIETIERLTTWTDSEFEFRVGLVSLGRGLPEYAADFVLEEGIEPRHVLLEASLLVDRRNRERSEATSADVRAPQATPHRDERGSKRAEATPQAAGAGLWLDDEASALERDGPGPGGAAESYLSLSEELFFAQERGEVGLVLLRYASERYPHGGLVLRDGRGFRVLGQFGEAFSWGGRREARASFAQGESPLFDAIVLDKRPYSGAVQMTESGGLAPAGLGAPGSVAALTIPLIVLGNVSLILFCRTAAAQPLDARALIALVRQVAVRYENLALLAITKAAGGAPEGRDSVDAVDTKEILVR